MSPARMSPGRRLEETDESQLERLYKPVFVLKPASFKCLEGQTARFDLKVVGRPMPETFWFHNGKHGTALLMSHWMCISNNEEKNLTFTLCFCFCFYVKPGQQIVNDYTHKVVIKEDGTQSLIIVPASPSDSGEWTVVAQNRAGKSTISVTLTVEGNKSFIKMKTSYFISHKQVFQPKLPKP